MKTYILILMFGVITLSCIKKSSKKVELETLLTEYNTQKVNQKFEDNFEEKIYNLRDQLIEPVDTSILFSLDSILLEGEADPRYKQEALAETDTLTIGRKCRTIDDAPADVARIKSNSLRLPDNSIEISVIFHVIQSDSGDGFIAENVLNQQLQVLNDTYASTLFSFKLMSIDSIKRSDWYDKVDIDSDEEKAMHEALSVDPERNLNVYFVGDIGYLGYAKFPWKDRTNFDGVVVYNATLPGGSEANYNEGKTLTHEVGHYLGLWHTFHKGCNVGDNVSDTPAQAFSTFGCPSGKDTCPSDPGLDPVSNYLDYSFDSCMTEFTRGQNQRMNWAVRKFRRDLIKLAI